MRDHDAKDQPIQIVDCFIRAVRYVRQGPGNDLVASTDDGATEAAIVAAACADADRRHSVIEP